MFSKQDPTLRAPTHTHQPLVSTGDRSLTHLSTTRLYPPVEGHCEQQEASTIHARPFSCRSFWHPPTTTRVVTAHSHSQRRMTDHHITPIVSQTTDEPIMPENAPKRELRLSLAEWRQQEAAITKESGFRQWFNSLFPTTSIRIAFICSLCAAIGVGIYWTQHTVQGKWVDSINHPQQVTTYEQVSSLPALFGLVITFYDQFTPPGRSFGRQATPEFFSTADNIYYKSTYINCNMTRLWYDAALCQPTDANGYALFRPQPGELTGESGLDVDLSPANYPAQFRGLTDNLCITSSLYLNTSGFTPPFYVSPLLGLLSLSAVETQEVSEYIHANITEPSAALFPLVNGISSPTPQPLNSRLLIQFKATKFVDIHGRSKLSYEWSQRTTLQPTTEAIKFMEQQVFNWSTPAEQAKILEYQADPDLTFYGLQLCLSPATFTVTVITEVSTYNWLAFLADAGGFLNLLSIAMLFLFPLAMRMTEPRNFLPLFLWEKYKQVTFPKTATATNDTNHTHIAAADQHTSPNPIHATFSSSPSAVGTTEVDISLQSLNRPDRIHTHGNVIPDQLLAPQSMTSDSTHL